jgi:hypothetical protein
VHAKFNGTGLLIYEVKNIKLGYADEKTNSSLFTFPSKANYSTNQIVKLNSAYQLVQYETTVLFLVNNSTNSIDASLALTTMVPPKNIVVNKNTTGTTGALSGLTIEFLSFVVLGLVAFVV